MADEVKKTPDVMIGGNVSSQPAFGAYSAESGRSDYARDVSKIVPYSLLEKTGKLPSDLNAQARAEEVSDALFARMRKGRAETRAVMEPQNRWLRELAITSTDKLDFQKAWETDSFRRQKSEHEWRDTYGGKLAIRAGSRGIAGSVFFVAGQHIAGNALKSYAYDPLNPANNSVLHSPIEYAARIIDKTSGKAIFNLVKTFTNEEKAAKAVTFRPTNSYEGYKGKAGRSYGHDSLMTTVDFSCASLGDWFGREIAGLIDPNTEKKWMKDGHVDMPGAAKALLKSVWTGVSKAAGEDYFAMAVGYPYVIRSTRYVIDKFSPGFKYDSDRALNGGSFKVDDHGKIVGNYQLEGMADLGIRFTVYNMFTKIFRDGYDKAANQIKHFWDGDRTLHMPHFDDPSPSNIARKTVDSIGNTAKYLARTVIKVSLIMIPSSSVFAFIRASQSKDLGLAIHPELGPVGITKEDGKWAPISTDGTFKDGKRSAYLITEDTKFTFKDGVQTSFNSFAPNKSKGYESRFDPYGQTTPSTQWHDRFTNPVGRFCHEGGRTLTEIVKPAARLFGGSSVSAGSISKHTQRYVDATLAYTPYFMAKTDLLNTAYDTPRMDMAIDRMIVGAAHLNFSEFKIGGGEVIHSILNRPFADPERESLAQKKMRTYTNQLWSNQDEIIAKEREEEYQDRMDAMLTLGKPIPMNELYRPSFADKVGRRFAAKSQDVANEPYYSQTITPMPSKKPEDYKKSEGSEWKQQANASWGQRAIKDFQTVTSSQGQTIN